MGGIPPFPCFQIHLFDIDVPGKIRFQESETLSPGNSLSVFETRERRPFSLVVFLMLRLLRDPPCLSLLPQPSVKWVWGFATTSDLQSSRSSTAGKVRVGWVLTAVFPGALTGWRGRVFALQGAELLVYPGAFNMTTGPAHWELLQRGRSDKYTQEPSKSYKYLWKQPKTSTYTREHSTDIFHTAEVHQAFKVLCRTVHPSVICVKSNTCV